MGGRVSLLFLEAPFCVSQGPLGEYSSSPPCVLPPPSFLRLPPLRVLSFLSSSSPSRRVYFSLPSVSLLFVSGCSCSLGITLLFTLIHPGLLFVLRSFRSFQLCFSYFTVRPVVTVSLEPRERAPWLKRGLCWPEPGSNGCWPPTINCVTDDERDIMAFKGGCVIYSGGEVTYYSGDRCATMLESVPTNTANAVGILCNFSCWLQLPCSSFPFTHTHTDMHSLVLVLDLLRYSVFNTWARVSRWLTQLLLCPSDHVQC